MKIFKRDFIFYRQVVAFALPIALQSMITIGVNLLDNIMVGQLGESVISAASFANTFISIYHILCMGLGMGASVLVSRYWGIKLTSLNSYDAENALRQTVSLMLRLTFLIASAFAIITWFCPNIIMKTYTDDQSVIDSGVLYFRCSAFTYFFLGLSLTSTIVLRSVGQVLLPLLVSIGAFFVNLIANYSLIFGHFGAPRLGIAGAAIGTLVARVFEFCIICGFLFIKDDRIGFRINHLFINTNSRLKEYMTICIPVLISDALLAFGNNAVAMVIGHLGVTFAAANSITSVTQQLSTVVIQGISQAGAIITGKTLGMGDREKTMEQGYLFLGLGLFFGCFSALFIMLFSDLIIHCYDISDEAIFIAKDLMLAISIIIVFQATNSIMTKGVLRGGGDTKMLMLTDNVFLWVVSIPLGIVAGFYFGLSPFWIYLCLKADQIIKTIWCVFRLKSGKWIKRIGNT